MKRLHLILIALLISATSIAQLDKKVNDKAQKSISDQKDNAQEQAKSLEDKANKAASEAKSTATDQGQKLDEAKDKASSMTESVKDFKTPENAKASLMQKISSSSTQIQGYAERIGPAKDLISSAWDKLNALKKKDPNNPEIKAKENKIKAAESKLQQYEGSIAKGKSLIEKGNSVIQ